MNNKYVIKHLDEIYNNDANLSSHSFLSSEDYADALLSWNDTSKYNDKEYNNWTDIVNYAFEGVFTSVADIIRYNHLSRAVDPKDNKFAFALENNVEFNYNFHSINDNIDFLKKNVLGIILANTHKTPSGKNILHINSIIMRPDQQEKGLGKEFLQEIILNPEQYLRQQIDGVSTTVNKHNQKSVKLFSGIGLIEPQESKNNKSMMTNLENSYDNILAKLQPQKQ